MVKKTPRYIKWLSVGMYFVALFCLFLGLIIFLVGYSIEKYSQNPNANYYDNLGSPMLTILLGISLFFIGTIFIFAGAGLWKGKRWARTLIVLNVLILILIGIYEIIFVNTLAGILIELIVISSLGSVVLKLFSDPEINRFFEEK